MLCQLISASVLHDMQTKETPEEFGLTPLFLAVEQRFEDMPFFEIKTDMLTSLACWVVSRQIKTLYFHFIFLSARLLWKNHENYCHLSISASFLYGLCWADGWFGSCFMYKRWCLHEWLFIYFMLCSCPTANSKERHSAQRGLSQATAVQIRSAALASTSATDAVSTN